MEYVTWEGIRFLKTELDEMYHREGTCALINPNEISSIDQKDNGYAVIFLNNKVYYYTKILFDDIIKLRKMSQLKARSTPVAGN